MRIRQSALATWMECPLAFRFTYVEGHATPQSCAQTHGTVMHACLEYMEETNDLPGAIERFHKWWADPDSLLAAQRAADPDAPNSQQRSLQVEYWLPGRSYEKYAKAAPKILTKWWEDHVQWSTDYVIGRELRFEVPIGDGHTIHGTLDKLSLRYNARAGSRVVQMSDWKLTQRVKQYAYDYLRQNLQVTTYLYATTRPEFWAGIGKPELHERLTPLQRRGEMLGVAVNKVFDAGPRDANDYARLAYAVNQVADSMSMGIYPPTISGESCLFCDHRLRCGLPALADEDSPQAERYG
jgi:hypothetical protein